jgi:hypothetical protein
MPAPLVKVTSITVVPLMPCTPLKLTLGCRDCTNSVFCGTV